VGLQTGYEGVSSEVLRFRGLALTRQVLGLRFEGSGFGVEGKVSGV